MAPQDFKLSAVLAGHQSDVRAVLLPDPSFAITASRDGSTRVWKQTSQSPPSYDPTESSQGATFKTCLSYVPSTKVYPDGLILSSGQDAIIEARQPSLTAEVNADAFMVGHSNQVCSLDACPGADWFVSGSWDSGARIWQIGRWETEVELKEHTATVWAVLAYDKDTVVTGCADHAIRVFDLRGKMAISFDGKDIVRALARLPEGHPTGAQIAAATNDGVVRLWALRGELMAELYGHESFIYSLAVLPSGEIVSSGEDRSVRVWQGTECVQVITLPAISVWSVSVCSNGDLIAGASDKLARIFTRDESRFAEASVQEEFDQMLQASSIPQQQIGGVNLTDLPGPDFLTRKSGTKEGQNQIIKDEDGNPTLYQWSMSQQTWIKIGQVVDSTGSDSSKVAFNGKDYDYVFDIDIEDGKPALKLPFNVTQNPYEAATKFLQDNELPLTYLEETANFIIKNTKGATLGQTQQEAPDPWGTENRYRPDSGPQQSQYVPPKPTPKQVLPQKEYLPIIVGKPAQAMAQITKRNSEYGDTDMALSKAEIDGLTKISQQLEKHNFSGKPSLVAKSELGAGIPGLIKAATQWQPATNRLAALDLLRFLAAALKDFPGATADDIDVVASILSSNIFDADHLRTNSKLIMIAIRFFSNLLYGSTSAKASVQDHIDSIVGSLEPVTSIAGSDSAIAVALTTLYLNIAVFATTDKSSDPDTSASRGLTLVEELTKLLSSFPAVNHASTATPGAQTTEPAYRAIVALGTIIVGLKSSDVTSAAKDLFDVSTVLGQLKTKKYLDEPRFQTVVTELRAALK